MPRRRDLAALPVVHRTARVGLRVTPGQRRRCWGLLRSAGDVWACVVEVNGWRRRRRDAPLAGYQELCRELAASGPGTFGDLDSTGARSVLRRFSDAWFGAAKRRKDGDDTARFPRRRRSLVPMRWYHGTFAIVGRRVRIPTARGTAPLWLRLARDLPYPVEQVRSVTLGCEGGRLFLDVTAEVPVATYEPGRGPDPGRVAGVDLGIIHPYAMTAGTFAAGRASDAAKADADGLPLVDLAPGGVDGDAMGGNDEARDGVSLTNLDQPMFEGANATKRDLVDYLDAVRDRIIPELRDRPLSVVRVLRGQAPFMQKNVPKYTPEWVRTVKLWAEASKREVSYALCNDRRTLLWFANQRAVEYHPTLYRADRWNHPTHLVLDLDPPVADAFPMAVRAAHLVRQALAEAGLAGAVKTSGAKGVHVFVPLEAPATHEEVAAATRAIAARAERLDPGLATTAYVRADRGGKVFLDSTRAGGATVVAAYSPRIRPGLPVSFPVAWDELDRVTPADFTVHTVARLIVGADPWVDQMPRPQRLGSDLIEEGRAIPVARVQAMHEGKRRARARRSPAVDPGEIP